MAEPGAPRDSLLLWSIVGGLVAAVMGLIAYVGPNAINPFAPAPAPAPSSATAPLPAQASPPIATAAPPPAAAPAPTPTFDVVRVSPQGNAIIAGRAEPGAEIIVRDGDQELARTRADRRGEFVAIPNAPLAEGGRELTLGARGSTGPEIKSEERVVFAIPAPPPSAAAPQISPVSPPVTALLVPNTGTPRILQDPRPTASTPAVTLDTVDYDDQGAIRFTGNAPPAGAPLRLYVDNAPAGDATSDAAGRWTLTPPATVAPGVHTLRVDRLDTSGRVMARVELPFQRAALPASDLAGGRVVVQPGQNLWRLARSAYGRGTQYTVIYLANRDQIRDPNRIYPGQAFAVPATP